MNYKELSKRILIFLDEYAAKNPNWEDEDDNPYTSPDADQLLYCAKCLENNIIPLQCFSEWGSGGYKPYTSKEGREEHDYLTNEIYKIIHNEGHN